MSSGPAPRSIEQVCASLTRRGGYGIRPWTRLDAPTLAAAWHDPEIARWNPVPPNPSADLASSWIDSTTSQNEASVGIDVVLSAPNNEVVGEIGLQVNPEQNIAEVGFWLVKSARAQGRARTLLAFAEDLAAEIEVLGLVGLTDAENTAAAAAMMSVGWVEIPTKSQRRGFAYRVPGILSGEV